MFWGTGLVLIITCPGSGSYHDGHLNSSIFLRKFANKEIKTTAEGVKPNSTQYLLYLPKNRFTPWALSVLGGVAVLERLLTAPDRALDRSSIDNNLRAYPQDSYGPEVASLTVTSAPLFLRKPPLPIVLSNFTVNIEELRIDAGSFGSSKLDN